MRHLHLRQHHGEGKFHGNFHQTLHWGMSSVHSSWAASCTAASVCVIHLVGRAIWEGHTILPRLKERDGENGIHAGIHQTSRHGDIHHWPATSLANGTLCNRSRPSAPQCAPLRVCCASRFQHLAAAGPIEGSHCTRTGCCEESMSNADWCQSAWFTTQLDRVTVDCGRVETHRIGEPCGLFQYGRANPLIRHRTCALFSQTVGYQLVDSSVALQ